MMSQIESRTRSAADKPRYSASAVNRNRARRLTTLGRAAACAAIGLAIMCLGGCESLVEKPVNATPPEPVVSTMIIDKAMQERDYAPIHAQFVNTTVNTGNDGVSYVPKRHLPDYDYYVLDTTTFLINIAMMPYSAWKIHPGTDVPNRGATFAPSFTDARPSTPF